MSEDIKDIRGYPVGSYEAGIREILVKAIDGGKNIFLTGPGGAGKSVLIREIIEAYQDEMTISITSTTGVSAINIGGITTHSFAGIRISNTIEEVDDCLYKDVNAKLKFKQLYNSGAPDKTLGKCLKSPKILTRIRDCQLLIIDEISMAGSNFMQLVDYAMREMRNEPDKVMGGIQVIFTGDFFQLSPVKDSFVFDGKVWKELNLEIIQLTKIYRFETDPVYSGIMERVRTASQTPEDEKILGKRKKAYRKFMKEEHPPNKIKPTELYCRNIDVNQTNLDELAKNPESLECLTAEDKFALDDGETPVGDKILNDIAPLELNLKVNAQVMITKNINVDSKLANGTRGIVKKITPDEITVELLDGKDYPITKYEHIYQTVMDGGGYKKTTRSFCPKFHEETDENGEKHHEFTGGYEIKDKQLKNRGMTQVIKAIRYQFPLKLAYAITIHKSQGCSLDSAVIDLGGDVFGHHMSYVALSRVRSLQGLYLKEFSPNRITVDPKVVEFLKDF